MTITGDTAMTWIEVGVGDSISSAIQFSLWRFESIRPLPIFDRRGESSSSGRPGPSSERTTAFVWLLWQVSRLGPNFVVLSRSFERVDARAA